MAGGRCRKEDHEEHCRQQQEAERCFERRVKGGERKDQCGQNGEHFPEPAYGNTGAAVDRANTAFLPATGVVSGRTPGTRQRGFFLCKTTTAKRANNCSRFHNPPRSVISVHTEITVHFSENVKQENHRGTEARRLGYKSKQVNSLRFSARAPIVTRTPSGNARSTT